ncbi:MAG: hypothetical protein HZA16_02000 [Nitrospirae bacterium]|nr:hypothetical protein [Nitrospirota bacterium]
MERKKMLTLILCVLLLAFAAGPPAVHAGDFDGCTDDACPNTRLFGQCNNSNGAPVREAIVRVYDADPVDHDYIGQAWTGDTGSWELTFENFTDCEGTLFHNHCPYPDDTLWENRRADAYMILYARNDAIADVFCPALVCPPAGGTWTFPHSAGPFVIRQDIGDGDQDYGTTSVIDLDGDPNTPGEDEAFTVFENLRRAWRYIEGQTGGVWVPQIGVEFPCQGGLFGLPCPGRPYFDPYFTHNIFLLRGAGQNTHVHEYGHFVMFQAYDQSWPPTPADQFGSISGGDFFNSDCMYHREPLSEECAWTEGWAGFLPLAVFDDSSSENTSGEQISSSAERYEGLVTGALWDALDASDDGFDKFSSSFEAIFDTLQAGWPGSCATYVDPPVGLQCISSQRNFRDFYRDWRLRGHDPIVLNAAAFQNRINVNNAPRMASLNAPSGTVYRGSSITITATGADDSGGFIDGLLSSATFEYSLNGTTWQPIVDVSSTGSDTFSLYWVIGFTAPSVTVRARVTDNLDTVSGWMQSAPFAVEAPQPDLIVEGITTNPVSPVPGQSISVTVTVKNQGDADAGSFITAFYKNEGTICEEICSDFGCLLYCGLPKPPYGADFTCSLGGLDAGLTTTCTGTVIYSSAGTYNMHAIVDKVISVTESDETNNAFGPQSITVQQPCTDADGDGYGSPGHASCPEGNATDCDDSDPSVNPEAAEIVCDYRDNNCDGLSDEGFPVGQGCYTGTGACQASGTFICMGAYELECDAVPGNPSPEICNNLDDDCNGQIDDGVLNIYYQDSDDDGYGNPAFFVYACSLPPGGHIVDNYADCNDFDESINPSASDVCDGIDNDCDGRIDNPGASVIAGPFLNPSNGHTYYAVANNTWTDAEAQAQLFGGHLVTINDDAENSWVWETFASQVGGRLWIGLTDAAQEGTFVWASGETASYFNWWCRSQTDCEPSNSGGAEHYVELNNYVWNDNINGQSLIGIVEIAEICDGVDNDCDGQIDEGFDSDGDGIADCDDNCPDHWNSDQVDTDGDGIGDACDQCDSLPVINGLTVDGCLSELCKSDLSASASDECGGNLTYTWTPLNGGAIIGSGAVVQFDPPDAGPHPCPYQVQLTVTSDLSGLSSNQTVDIRIKPAGDVNGDGVVNLMDKLLVRQHFGQSAGDPNWDARADATCDGVVNLMDKLKVRQQFGQTGGCGCQ